MKRGVKKLRFSLVFKVGAVFVYDELFICSCMSVYDEPGKTCMRGKAELLELTLEG